jgi:hypothetical protein
MRPCKGKPAPNGKAPRFVRFWIIAHGSPVRLTLRAGGGSSWSTWKRPADEGWSAEGAGYSYDAERGIVSRYTWTDGVDCDGRLSGEEHATCVHDRLASFVTPEGLAVPDWQYGRCRQRDYAAEAAGY